jgi:2-polyprenyl-6-methoxyphenol hydroxylase-like FAD-dependent oxidoreductase
MSKSCIIIGGGIAGPVAALTLSRIGIQCIIYELRETPATIGGAVNLTPNALKLFAELGVEVSGCVVHDIEIFSYHSGARIANLPFRGPGGPSVRIERENLLKTLLDAVEKAGVKVIYGSKLVSIVDHDDGDMVAVFENNTSAKANFIVGCDGMYSATRMKYVDPERIPVFTGVACAYSIVDARDLKSPIHFQRTGMNVGRYGSLLSTYVDSDQAMMYLTAVMETEERESKEGWRARGLDHEKTVDEIRRRFADAAFPCLPELLERVKEYIYYPVYKLSPGGTWSRGKVVLLGDAAHGVSSLFNFP